MIDLEDDRAGRKYHSCNDKNQQKCEISHSIE